jgi:BlaI family transcriptional regulator, penicillinase repressor
MPRAAAARAIPPPLELLCLRALWSLGEGNVNDVRQAISPHRALAYTTVMTLLERLARKGLVSRRKVSRAFVYSPAMSRDALRRLALRELLEYYFDGSEQQLLAFLQRREIPPAAEAEPRLDTALL